MSISVYSVELKPRSTFVGGVLGLVSFIGSTARVKQFHMNKMKLFKRTNIQTTIKAYILLRFHFYHLALRRT